MKKKSIPTQKIAVSIAYSNVLVKKIQENLRIYLKTIDENE